LAIWQEIIWQFGEYANNPNEINDNIIKGYCYHTHDQNHRKEATIKSNKSHLTNHFKNDKRKSEICRFDKQ